MLAEFDGIIPSLLSGIQRPLNPVAVDMNLFFIVHQTTGLS